MHPHTASASVILQLNTCIIPTETDRKPLTNAGYQMQKYEMVKYKNWLGKLKCHQPQKSIQITNVILHT
jgi:hypothetical protein